MPRSADVDDRRTPLLGAEPAQADEQRLVQPQRLDGADPVGVGFEECFAVGDNGVVDGVPVATQLGGDVADTTRGTSTRHSADIVPSAPSQGTNGTTFDWNKAFSRRSRWRITSPVCTRLASSIAAS
jgi:hypothetical protein